MRESFILALVLVLASMLVGCGQPVVPVGPSPTQNTAAGEPTSARTPASIAATPAPGTGLVTGVALWEEEDNQPATEIDLYLAEVSEVVEGGTSVAKLDAGSAPKAVVYQTGAFIFTDIPPGSYALVASISPANSTLILDSETSTELVISVEAGDIVDLGTVYIPSLW